MFGFMENPKREEHCRFLQLAGVGDTIDTILEVFIA